MIREQWYAVLDSKEVKKGQPISVVRMGEKMVFWRDQEGKTKCVFDRCAHRGAELSKGKIVEGNIQCPFHGFEYNAKGQCTVIPAKGKNAPVPEYIKVKAYPVQESMDLIWIYWGEWKEQEDLPPVPKFKGLTKKHSYGQFIDHWPVHYSRAVENQLDVVHLPFVHYNTIGRGQRTIVDGPITKFEEGEIRFWVNNRREDGSTYRKLDELSEPRRRHQIAFKFGNIWENYFGESSRIIAAFAPVDEKNTVIYLRMYQSVVRLPLLRGIFNWVAKRGNKVILRQDKRVVITQQPIKSELRMDEKLIHGDAPIILFRKLRQELKEKAEKEKEEN